MQRQQDSSDIVMLVMGITGVGKSAFISSFTGQDTGIGHELKSFTMGVDIYSHEHDGRRIHLVDTPGFNDTWRADIDILKEVAFILSQLHRNGIKFSGILYLHRITDNRVSGSTLKNFRVLEKICGPEAAQRVVLVTTMWDLVEAGKLDRDEAEMRERRLGATINYWGTLCSHGSTLRRHRGHQESASSIVDELIALNETGGYKTHRIQQELVDEKLSLINTSVGKLMLAGLDGSKDQDETGSEINLPAHNQRIALEHSGDDTDKDSMAKAELHISFEGLIASREPEYGKVLSNVCREQEQLALTIEQGEKQLDLLSMDIKAFDDTLEEQRQQWRDQRRELNQSVRERRRRQRSVDKELQRVEAEEKDFEAHCAVFMGESQQKKREELNKMERLRKRDVAKRNLRPFLMMLAGIGLTVAGGVTGIAPLLGAGFGLSLTSANDFEFSRTRVVKVPEDERGRTKGRALPNAGQGAAGASIN